MIASRFINFFLAFIAGELLIFILLIGSWKDRKIWSFFSCLVSILVVVSICFFPFPFQTELVSDMISEGVGTLNNYIPFKTISTTIYEGIKYKAYGVIVYQLIGNVILFVPIGISLYFFSEENKTINRILTVAFMVSISIEILQGMFNSFLQINYRSIDIDDVILNVLGGGIGCYIAKKIKMLIRKNAYNNKKTKDVTEV